MKKTRLPLSLKTVLEQKQSPIRLVGFAAQTETLTLGRMSSDSLGDRQNPWTLWCFLKRDGNHYHTVFSEVSAMQKFSKISNLPLSQTSDTSGEFLGVKCKFSITFVSTQPVLRITGSASFAEINNPAKSTSVPVSVSV